MSIRHSGLLALVAGIAVVACESTATPPSSTPAASSPAPVVIAAAASAAPTATGTSCLMTHICGCNLGCARIPVDAASLREGMRTKAQTGAYAGKEMIVTQEADATGASVFALSDRDRTGACENATPQSKALVGFACATKDSGPIPGRACARGCE